MKKNTLNLGKEGAIKRLQVFALCICMGSFGARAQSSGKIAGHEYVDLGLSVVWATCNVGASSPSDYGNYYAWGETATKSAYTEANSTTYGKKMGDIAGNPQYDAARKNWGGTWRMPTRYELDELREKCTWTWTTQGGKNGYKVTGPNGKSIFLPAAGHRKGSSLNYAGEDGNYWSSASVVFNPHGAYPLLFDSREYIEYGLSRSLGQSVRPVSEKTASAAQASTASRPSSAGGVGGASPSGKINGHDYVDLGLSVKWAACNVGSSSPSDYGNYYAWGETATKSAYTEANSVTYKKSMGDIGGNPQYDAARKNWGGTWRLPTLNEIKELKEKCTWTWTTQGGKNGYKVTGPNGKSIFLPAAGGRRGSSLSGTGEHSRYWSSTPGGDYMDDACYLYFNGRYYEWNWSYRGYGQSVRPVSE